MHRTALLYAAICFMLIGAASLFLSSRAVSYIEDATQDQLSKALRASGQNWATIRPDGLAVHLTGLAPNEASRFQAIEIMGQLIDSNRVEDSTKVLQSSDIVKPRFTLEVLRNLDRISLIGMIPERIGRSFILDRAEKIADGGTVTDMLESAEHRVPPGWARNLNYGLDILEKLPRSKISITSEDVRITAVTESPEEQAEVKQLLMTTKPEGLKLVMDISAPRPVITPFHFRMILQDGKVNLQACSADTRASANRILRNVRKAGETRKLNCAIGLGVPTTEWDQAIIQSVQALVALGGGILTVNDSDISLVSAGSASQNLFDGVIGKLENSLPELFSLQATLPPKILTEDSGKVVEAPEFIATRSPEGLVQLTGRLQNKLAKQSVGAFAGALFGAGNVDNNTRIDPELPDGWPRRVLAGLEALAKLHHGAVTVQPENLTVQGISASDEYAAELSELFSKHFQAGEKYKLDVRHDPKLIVVNSKLEARDCEAQIRAVLDEQQIVFAPGSANIEARSQGVLDAIAEILRECVNTPFEIQGHTDSQGRDEMNLNLSQQRAEAVLHGLLARRVLINGITAKGYGEEQPIADNETEGGRAANRRIAFRLMIDPEDGTTDTEEVDTTDVE